MEWGGSKCFFCVCVRDWASEKLSGRVQLEGHLGPVQTSCFCRAKLNCNRFDCSTTQNDSDPDVVPNSGLTEVT